MTITQMECFVEAAKTLNFTRAAENLYISQQVMSRQIRALEKELGFPVFERRNTGVILTAAGESLYRDWKDLLERHRSSVDRARDIDQGERRAFRVGLSDMGNIVTRATHALLDFNEKYPDLNIEYEVDTYPQMRCELENGKLHVLITFGVEILHEKDWHSIGIKQTGFRPGIILNKRHPLNNKKDLTIQDVQYETIGVLSEQISVDNKSRVQREFMKKGIFHPLDLREYDSFANLQVAMAMGKCIGVMYERLMDGMEDKLNFYPVEETDLVGREIVVAWKDARYAVKAKNLAEVLEEHLKEAMYNTETAGMHSR